MKTAMQELKSIIELYDDNDTKTTLLAWIDKLGLITEKKQIVDAYTMGCEDYSGFSDIKDSEKYYNNTFTTTQQ